MYKETKKQRDQRVEKILEALDREYGREYRCYLNYETDWQLLFAVIMSAQCTDARVNQVTETLYQKYRSLQDFADADLKEMEEDIHSTILVIKNYDGEDLGRLRANLATYGIIKVRSYEGSEGGVDTLQIEVNAENGTVAYSVEGEAASVSETGLVTGLAAGKATVKAYLVEDETVFDTIELDVVDTILDTAVNPTVWDYEGLYSATPTLTNLEGQNGYATFRGVKGKEYMMKAKVLITNPNATDTWSRVSLGHVNEDNGAFHGMMLSPGANFAAPKTVVMDINASGEVAWGETTDRSQIWNHHGLSSFDWTQPIELTSVRSGDLYYYFINGELFWMESNYLDLTAVDTLPAILVGQCKVDVSEMSVTTDAEEIGAFLSTDAAKQTLYPTDPAHVEITNLGKKVVFSGADEGAATNPKDFGAKSIGDAFTLPANKQATVSFDLTVQSWGGTDGMPSLVFNVNRYLNPVAESRAYIISEFGAGFSGWNNNADLPAGIGTGVQPYADGVRIEVDQTYHVEATRLMTENGQDTRIVISSGETVLLDFTHNWQDGYSGIAYGSFLSRNLNCTVDNIAISIAE